MTQLEKINIRLGLDGLDQSKTNLIIQLIEDAESYILDLTNRSQITNELEPLVREVAIIYWNRLGDEGTTSRSEGGISVSYEVPEDIFKRIRKYRKLR